MASRSAPALLRALLPSPAPRLPFFLPSLAPPPPSSLARTPFFSPARSLSSARLGVFTPSFAPALLARPTAAPSSPFAALRSSFRQASFSPSIRRSTLPGRRDFSTSTLRRAIRPYLGRGRSGTGYGGYGRRPPPGWKERIDRLPEMWVLIGLISLNVAVFLAWQYGTQVYQRFRDASIFRFMTRNFTVSWQNLTSGRIWTLLTSAFSHEGASHFLVNMLSLWFMGGAAISILGNAGFLSLYLFSGFVSSAFSALFAHYVAKNPYYAAHGASGSVFACASFFALAFPHSKFLLFFVVPVPAWLCVGGLFAWDLYSGLARTGGTTDSMGHVGGAIAGALFFLRKIGRI
ncbi:hypothetical protein JCM8097_000674 [Rhodosporidiobolus ruineniae]